MTAKVDAGVYPVCIFLFHWILSVRVVGAFPLLTSSRPSQKDIRLCRHSRVNDHIMQIKSLLLNLIVGSAIISFLTSLLTQDATNFLEKRIPFVLWRIVFVVGTTMVVILLYSLIEVGSRRKGKRRHTKKQKAICACNSTGPLPDSNGTTPLPNCNGTAPLSLTDSNGTALQPLQDSNSRALQPQQDSNSRAPPSLQNSNGVATPPLQDFNGTEPPTRLVHLESPLATAPEGIRDLHPQGTLATNPEKEQEHLHPEETKALVPREDTQHSALQENSTSQGTSTRRRDPELDLVIQDMFDCLITEKRVQEFCDPRDFVAITIPNNNCQPATVEAALGFSVTLPVGSKVVYKWFEVGPQTTQDQLHTLKLQVMESVREAQEIDKDFTLQLGSFAVLKYTDHGPKWWRLQEHWIPTISNIQRSPWNLLDLLTGRSPTWIMRGFNLQNAQLKFSNFDEKKMLSILRGYKMESGEDMLLCEEPYDLTLLFRKEIYICALNSVEVEEGVIVNLQSNPHRVHNKTYWVSVVQGLIPSQWALLVLASLSLHNIVTGGINLQGTSIFAHILGKALYKFLIYIFSYFILVLVLTFWRLTYGRVQRAVTRLTLVIKSLWILRNTRTSLELLECEPVSLLGESADDVPSPRIVTSCEGSDNDRRRISPLPDGPNNVDIEEKDGEEVIEEKGSWPEEEKQEEEEGSCLEEEKREEEQSGSCLKEEKQEEVQEGSWLKEHKKEEEGSRLEEVKEEEEDEGSCLEEEKQEDEKRSYLEEKEEGSCLEEEEEGSCLEEEKQENEERPWLEEQEEVQEGSWLQEEEEVQEGLWLQEEEVQEGSWLQEEEEVQEGSWLEEHKKEEEGSRLEEDKQEEGDDVADRQTGIPSQDLNHPHSHSPPLSDDYEVVEMDVDAEEKQEEEGQEIYGAASTPTSADNVKRTPQFAMVEYKSIGENDNIAKHGDYVPRPRTTATYEEELRRSRRPNVSSPHTSSADPSTKFKYLVRRLKETKKIWERGEGPELEDPEFQELLVDPFKEVSDITEMNLVGEDLQDIIVSAMGTAMMEVPFPRLTSLQLGGNYITEVGIRAVAKAIKLGHLPALESLGLFPRRTADERDRFSRREEAQWIRNLIRDDGVKALASAFGAGHASRLKVLTLEQNGFGKEGVTALATVIQAGHLRSLEILNVSYNDVGDEGIRLLANAFVEAGNNVRVLDLETCNIFMEGTKALASALRSGRFSALTELYLGNNNQVMGPIWEGFWRGPRETQRLAPTDEGLMELAEVLQMGWLPMVQILDLENNTIGSRKVAEAFRSAVRYNQSLVLTLKINWPSFAPYESSVRKYLDRNRRTAKILARLGGEEDVPGTSGKVFLCGLPMEGKTTLRRSLQYDLPTRFSTFTRRRRDEPRTRGIEVSHIVSKGIRLAIWDLAGQAEYHILHSAFLPDLALADGPSTTFVIVCNAKYPGSDTGNGHLGKEILNYWMRFIASSSLRGQEMGKRHVIVVLNRFDDEPCEYEDQWKKYLAECNEKFHDYLVVEENPFVVDARMPRSVRLLKEHLIDHTRQKLKIKKVPKICQLIQDTILQESAKTRDFPVVTWDGFAPLFQSSVSDQAKLKAAVDYLHESGHLIHFREGFRVNHSNEGSSGLGRGLVVLNPDWFCRRVVGDLLLPDTHSMLRDGDRPLSRRLQADGSVDLQDLKDYFHHLKFGEQQVSDIVAMLLRLGICYMAGTENVLIPALISDKVPEGNQNPTGFWELSEMQKVREQWVMGYCLKVQYTTTTLLPIAVFRRLQVELAQESMCAAADSQYTCGKFNITFGTNGMAVLVEFSANEDRVDILVRPLVGRDLLGRERRRELQVKLAQLILEKLVELAEYWSPGVELMRLVVKPWCTTNGLLSMDRRNVTLSVDEVKSRVEAGETTMAWTVDEELVNLIDLLSGSELRELESSLGQRCDEVEQLIVELDLGAATEPQADDPADHSGELIVEEDPGVQSIKRHFDRGMQRLSTQMDDLMRTMESVRKDLGKVLRRQEKVLKRLQALERFTRDEIRNSVPRFMYLTKAESPSGIWMNLTNIFVETGTLHFLCEAQYNVHSLHEVADQKGVEIRNLTELAGRITPWLSWSLKVAFVVGKVASQALLPGLGQLIEALPQGGSASVDYNRGTAIGYWVTAVLIGSSELNKQFSGTSIDTSSIQDNRSTPLRPAEVEGGLKGVLKDMIGDMGDRDFQVKFKLRRAVMKNSGYVVWICNDCFHKYQYEGAVESL